MKTVLILGAGLTRAARPRAPLSKRPPLDTDFFDIAARADPAELKEVRECLALIFGEYAGTLLRSLETSTSYLYLKALDAKPKDPARKGFLSLLRLLRSVLAQATNEIKPGRRSLLYRFLRSELKAARDFRDLSIITFNYDLLIERSLAELNKVNGGKIFHFPGCYRLTHIDKSNVFNTAPPEPVASASLNHEGIPVYKLHGSLNWFSAHRSDNPSPQALFKDTRQIYVLNSPKIMSKARWKRGKQSLRMNAVIVPPVSGKRRMMHREMASIWNFAAKALQEAERIVIAGYSCPPLDIETRILLSENLRKSVARSPVRVYVIDPNPESGAKFSSICGVDHITIYDSVKDWIRDAKLVGK